MKHIYLSCTKLVVSILFLQFLVNSANAQWSTNPTANNAICKASDIQRGQGYNQFHTMVSDGSGGAIITWTDYRIGNGTSDIYAQRIDANGIVKWTTDGVPICTDASSQRDPTITSDGNGGAIIVWWDSRLSKIEIYAQRVNSSGVVQWTIDGVRISTSTASTIQQSPNIVSDGSNGAIITWEDYNIYSTSSDIYAQRINAAGVLLWTANGVVISIAQYTQQMPTIASDGSGGAIIAWRDGRSVAPGFYAQRINANGLVQWTTDGVAVCTAASPGGNANITNDGNGGAIFTWQDGRSGFDIYAQRINSAGSVQWTTNGVAICTAPNGQQSQDIVGDGVGGAIVTWDDARSVSGSDVYAQRINANGLVQWTTDGVPISTATNQQGTPVITSDGNGGAIIAWRDYRSPVTLADTYAQRINSYGVVQWTINGVAISTAAVGQELPSIVSDGGGGAIITWRDSRNGVSNYDVYAQQVGANGALGNITTGVEEQPAMNSNLNLAQNYPNPFEQTTKIKYEISNGQMVTLKVYNLFGKEIRSLINEVKPAGTYEVDFNASGITPGIYVYKLKAGSSELMKKMIILE